MKSLILICLLLSSVAHGAFEMTQHRYLAPYDVFKTIQQILPLTAKEQLELPATCRGLTPGNRTVIGDSEPGLGHPAIPRPSGGFVRWWSSCLNAQIDLAVQTDEQAAKVLGVPTKDLATSWTALDAKTREKFMHVQIAKMIGPPAVLRDFGTSESTLMSAIEASMTGRESLKVALKKTIFFLGLRDEFLSY